MTAKKTAAELGFSAIDLTALDLDAMSAVELRKVGAQAGVAGASRAKKADILAALAPLKADQEKAKEEAAKPAKPAKKAKTEKAPKVRKIRFSQDDLAMEENGHSDEAHEDIAKGNVSGFSAKRLAEVREVMETCPICHPEIVANSAHSGSSRAGMVINVPLRADGRTKAETVAARLDAVKIPAKLRRFKGEEILTAEIDGTELKLVWDAQGRYVYALSRFGTRKVRNVSEALRLAVTA